MRGAALVTVLAALLGLAPPVSGAEEKTPDTPEGRADLLLEASGLDASLASMADSIGDQAAAQLSPQPEAADSENTRELVEIYRRAFDGKRLRAHVIAQLVAVDDPEKARRVIDWYRSATGEKLRAASDPLNGPEGQAALGLWIQGLQADPPSPVRLALVERLDAATGATDQFTALIGTLSVAMVRGLAAAMPKDATQTSEAEAEQTLATVRDQLRPVMQRQALVILLYSTRTLSDAEFEGYVAESEGPAARWFNDAAFRGMQEGFAEASHSLGTALGEWLPKQLDEHTLEARRVEGRSFGTGKVDRACVAAGLEHDGACSGFACHFEASAFMEGCLEAATQTEALCENVPDPDDIAATVPWRVGGCAGAGRGDNFCRHLLSRVQAHCHSKPSAAGA